MELRQHRVPKKQKAPIEVPDLVGTDSGRLSLTYKKASSAQPGRTSLHLRVYQIVIALSSRKCVIHKLLKGRILARLRQAGLPQAGHTLV
jgi:hypothetical protein